MWLRGDLVLVLTLRKHEARVHERLPVEARLPGKRRRGWSWQAPIVTGKLPEIARLIPQDRSSDLEALLELFQLSPAPKVVLHPVCQHARI